MGLIGAIPSRKCSILRDLQNEDITHSVMLPEALEHFVLLKTQTWPICFEDSSSRVGLTKNRYKTSFFSSFSKFYGKVGVIFWFLFHLIWKIYVLYWDFDLTSWIVDFLTRFICEKTPQNIFSSQNFSVENKYFYKINVLH